MLTRRHTKILIEELPAILSSGPSDTIAFLSSKSSARAVVETLAALANSSGGLLVMGVNKRGKPQIGADVAAMRELSAESALRIEPPLILPSPQVLTTTDLVTAGVITAGDINTGDINTGDINTGDINTSNINTGDINTSNINTDDINTSASSQPIQNPADPPSPSGANSGANANGGANSTDALTAQSGGIVLLQVPAGLPHIYSAQGRYLTRTEGQNRPLSTSELRSLMLERGDTGYEGMPATGVTLSELEQQKIERYLELISAPPDENALQVLLSRGCVVYEYASTDDDTADGQEGSTASDEESSQEREKAENSEHLVPTTAGILLFGRNPQQFVRSAEIICVRYAGPTMTDEFVRQDIIGTLPEQIRQAEAFVSSNMRRGMRIAGMERDEITEYPMAVVREAIVNAIAHRDYSIRGEGIRLLMFSNRLEVYSPGRLPGHVTLDNLINERYSRNEAIVAVLTDMGYIERLGYGIDRMISSMEAASLPAPKFTEMAAGFRVTLESAGEDLVSTAPVQQQWQHDSLNNRQEQALAYVRDTGRITNSDYQAMCSDVSPETLRRDLSDLVDKNLLLRIGSKRSTYYILK